MVFVYLRSCELQHHRACFITLGEYSLYYVNHITHIKYTISYTEHSCICLPCTIVWNSVQDAASARLHVAYVLKVSFEFECWKTLKHRHLHNNSYVRHRLPETSRQSISLGVAFKAVWAGPVNIPFQRKRQVQLTWCLQHTGTCMYNLLWLCIACVNQKSFHSTQGFCNKISGNHSNIAI